MHTAPLTGLDWTFAVGGGFLYLIIRETYKYFRNRMLEAKEARAVATSFL
jgi:hypothetical protein